MLLLQIRGNHPSASGPLTLWKITELCQDYKNKSWGFQCCISRVVERTANSATWCAPYCHPGTFLMGEAPAVSQEGDSLHVICRPCVLAIWFFGVWGLAELMSRNITHLHTTGS